MNRTLLATAVLAGAVAVGAVTGTGLHALGWELRPDTGVVRVGAASPAEQTGRASTNKPTVAPTAKAPTAATGSRVAGEHNSTLHLLAADEVGGFNDSWRWIVASTQPGEGKFRDAFCQQSSLADLGASAVTRRDFAGASRKSNDTAAGQLLATFPSAGAASKAYQQMRRWQATCKASMHKRGFTTAKVQSFEPVRSNAEHAGWWLGIFAPVNPDLPNTYTDEGWFSATGIAVDGNTVTLVWIKLIGMDYNYDAGREPMVPTLVNASSVVGGP